jgi:Domain of unknown function (DUF4158)
MRFVADQLGTAPKALVTYAVRFQTRYEQLGVLRAAFGFTDLTPRRRQILEWLLPVSLATTNPLTVRHGAAGRTAPASDRRARAIHHRTPDRRRPHAGGTAPGEPTRRRSDQGTIRRAGGAARAEAGHGNKRARLGTPAAGGAGTRGAQTDFRTACLRAVGLDPTCADGVRAERLRRLAREGGRLTAQHLRMLSPLRRRATLVATVLDTTVRLTDDGVALFDRAGGTDLDGAVATAVGWEKLAASIAEAERLARPDKADLPALAARSWPVLHRLGPVFLEAFKLRALPAAALALRAVELQHDAYRSGGRTWPQSLPVSFLRAAWRDAGRPFALRSSVGRAARDAGGMVSCAASASRTALVRPAPSRTAPASKTSTKCSLPAQDSALPLNRNRSR